MPGDLFHAEQEATGVFTPAGMDPTVAAAVPERLGPFRVLEPLGRGGMGLVFRARQWDPVERDVALKLLPSALDATMRSLFEIERHSLARMQHPAIAQLYEAGTTEDGRPWFAMELVAGQTLDAYCQERRLDQAAKIRLLIRVCRGVQHAHDRGIVHRDLKPGNILVQVLDGEGMPKLIDFGIASATSVRAMHAGTDAYMSPEQQHDHDVADVRHDVYALGVMACQLLAGLVPAEVTAVVRELGLECSGDARPGERPAEHAGTRQRWLRQRLVQLSPATRGALSSDISGELGYLLARAVSPSQVERYDSARQLADDLQRLLDGAPISAHPQTRGYLVRKFVVRHRWMIAGAATVLTGLLVALTIALLALHQAQQQRDLARAAEIEAARQARIAGSVNRFLVEDLLGTANLDEQPNADRLTLLEAVETAAGSLQRESGIEPEAEADIRFALGHSLASLGRFEAAREAFDRAAVLRRDVIGTDHPATLAAEAESASMLVDLSQHEQAEQRLGNLMQRALSAAPEPTLLHDLRLKLARNAIFSGNYERPESWLRQVLAGTQSAKQIDQARRLQAWLFSRTGRHAEAVASFRVLLEDTRRRFGDGSWPTLMSAGALATALHRAGELSEALAIRAGVIAGIRERFPGHSELGVQLSHLAAHQLLLGEGVAAERSALEAIERLTRQFGARHRMLGNAHSHLGAALLLLGRNDEAGRALLAAQDIFNASLPPEHPLIAQNQERITEWQSRRTE